MKYSPPTIVGTVLFMLATFAGSITAETQSACSELVSSEEDSVKRQSTRLKRMYQLAAQQELMFYGIDKAEECRSSEDDGVLVDPLDMLKEADVLSGLDDQQQFIALFGNIETVALLLTDQGKLGRQHHISCHGVDPEVELAIGLYLMETTLYYYDDEGGEIKGLVPHVSIEVDFVIPESILQQMDQSVREEIQVATTIVQSNNGSGHREPVFLIRGTDLDRLIPQLAASIKGAWNQSCAFSAAAKLVSNLKRYYGDKSHIDGELIIVGSSLGGSAVQHIATDPDTPLSKIEGYSFNGMGVPAERVDPNRPNEMLYSYTVRGDWINGMRELFGQTEAGNKWRYDPMDTFWGPWLTGRHSIQSVRRSLCRCVDGRGALVTVPWSIE